MYDKKRGLMVVVLCILLLFSIYYFFIKDVGAYKLNLATVELCEFVSDDYKFVLKDEFKPGDDLHVMFEMLNLGDENGRVRYSINVETTLNGLEVEELSGELINEDDYYYDFGYSAAKAVVKIPYLIDSGKYYMKFTVKDEYLKHEDVIEKVLVVEEELNVAGIQSAFYVDEEDFSIIPVESFTSEDMVYIYSELSGFKQAKTIHGYKYDFRQEVEVVGENVSGVMENEYQGVSKELLAYFKARNYFLAEGLEPGVYGVKVKLIDRIASKEVVEEGYFIIE